MTHRCKMQQVSSLYKRFFLVTARLVGSGGGDGGGVCQERNALKINKLNEKKTTGSKCLWIDIQFFFRCKFPHKL
ncbi:hypothetical protein DERF_013470 [Dermatophagoides farinae]|uniref:Uncharacterized protein n=1 Tax=Dermatophagoides farinae TaxID=6954 RepID=A0A922HPL1_DERFA|nr:hypothetical protein DERF_013470 [Dermatophagoides farinae]